MQKIRIIAFATLLALTACKARLTVDSTIPKQYPVNQASIDSGVYKIYLPYKLRLDSLMNKTIGSTEKELTKNTPEGTLGNFVTDASMAMAKVKGFSPDFCFMNNGGLRNPIPKGDITVRSIFELMPFENELVLITLSGKDVRDVLDYIASKGGTPISGAKFVISSKKAKDIKIQNQSFDDTKTYTILTSDYLASGGDGLEMLAKADKKVMNLKVRDALLDYFKLNNSPKLNITIDGRIQ